VASENFNIIKLDTISGDQSVAKFWSMYKAGTIIVSFNGRNFDLPLLELMAFKNGITLPSNYWAKYGPRNRFGDGHIDLIDFIGNNGAHRVPGGLDLLSKLVDRPGKEIVDGVKMDGSRVYGMYMDEEYDQIATYCKRDLLDTYAVFLRTRVMIGDINTNREAELLKLSSNFE
jgi:predicted PolB exonuclease-like 3'-5' exonuclease